MIGGRYSLEEQIGVGGMATVWRATDHVLGRKVAIKRPASHLLTDPQASERFRREAQAAARLNHPGILVVHDAGEDEDGPWIAMELINGETLADRLAREGSLDVPTTINVVQQVAAALDHAHQHGVIHRDVKPANLVLEPEGRIRLTDFGIAKPLEDSATVTTTGEMVGTVSYLAPEILRGEPAAPASDIYSLGAVVYEMVTGRKPFAAPTTAELFAAIRDQQPPAMAGAVPRSVERAVIQALDKNPERRPPTAGEFAAELAQDATLVFESPPPAAPPEPESTVLTSGPEEPTMVTAPPQAVTTSRPGRKLPLVGVLVGLLVVAALVAWRATPNGDADEVSEMPAAATSDTTLADTTTSEATTTTSGSTTTSTVRQSVALILEDIDRHLATMGPPTFRPPDLREIGRHVDEAAQHWQEGDNSKAADQLQKAFDATTKLADTEQRDELVDLLVSLAEAMGFEVEPAD
ncbi:MAG TPA: serine/threonine-protein kinase [Acidimicrobiia bacterium]|nr:serine/threonine-protein kinase [Acidimicrobiia bacterium]